MCINAAGIDVSGEKNPNWKGGTIRKVCDVCGQEYFVKKCHSKSRFCSLRCVGVSQRGKKRQSKKLIPLQCEVCGGVFFVFKSHAHKWHCCSKECSHKRRSEIMAGDKNPNWNGGLSRLPYPWNFKKISRSIISRDGFRCQNPNCDGSDVRLTSHHIDYDKQNCSGSNLITLCSACNSMANFNRGYWSALYSSIIAAKRDGGGWIEEAF